MSTEQPEEEFVEMRPASEGFNLRHWKGWDHTTGPDCLCTPGFIQQSGEPADPNGPAVEIHWSDAQPDEHECVFIEEQEPSGRLVLPPCITCGTTAMDALLQLRGES